MVIYSKGNGDETIFEQLIETVTEKLNEDANERPAYYETRGGTKLEEDVFKIFCAVAEGTPFEGTIRRSTRQKFPDIIAKRYFGVEVKTTKGKSWTSTGSSIVESTREADVERIYLLFGKLSHPIGFKAKRYEECLSDIVVTHSPRYKIDMELAKNETIFEKMSVMYDDFRNDEDSIDIVKNYYRNNLKSGQNLWWIDSEPIDEQAVSPIVKMWNTLTKEEKVNLQVKGFCWFPEIFGRSPIKYNRFALWLVTQKGVVATSLRDIFTAGGRMNIKTANNVWENQPQIFYKMKEVKEAIVEEINSANIEWIREFWGHDADAHHDITRIEQWIHLVVDNVTGNTRETKEMLQNIFHQV